MNDKGFPEITMRLRGLSAPGRIILVVAVVALALLVAVPIGMAQWSRPVVTGPATGTGTGTPTRVVDPMPSKTTLISPPVAPGIPTASSPGNVSDGHQGCPPSLAGQGKDYVPGPPAIDTAGRLTPPSAPQAVVLCRYRLDQPVVRPGESTRPIVPGALDGRVVLTGSLDEVGADLSGAPRHDPLAQRPCTLIGGQTTAYLAALEYDGGLVWVRGDDDPNRCEGSTNGAFVSQAHLGQQFARSFDQGQWRR